MFGILLSALNAALGFVFRAVVVKFIVFTALFLITSGFVQVLLEDNLLPSVGGVSSAFSTIPSGVWFFLELFAVDTGVPLVFAALATRFIIRRLPIIG